MGINVLSLFDGISCGQIALERAGIDYENYFASEIDPSAIKITQHNYPKTVQLGDAKLIQGKDLPKIDLIMGGSPCQGFSTIGKNLNFEDPRSKLFFEFVRLIEECNPRYFMLENVSMNSSNLSIISFYLGVKPVLINSNLVSAQNRKRYYWTNVKNITQPKDKNIFLSDVIDHDFKDYKIPKNWYKRVPSSRPMYCDPYNINTVVNKSSTLRTNINNGNMWVRVKEGYRNLTPYECERLQTIPEGYTNIVSDSQAKKCVSNAWTVDIIAHIFKELNKGENHAHQNKPNN